MAELFDVLPNREYTLGDMQAELKRELSMRQSVYPRRVAAGKMRNSVATWQINCLKAVLALVEQRMEEVRSGDTIASLRAKIADLEKDLKQERFDHAADMER
jgi:hypothetical protein